MRGEKRGLKRNLRRKNAAGTKNILCSFKGVSVCGGNGRPLLKKNRAKKGQREKSFGEAEKGGDLDTHSFKDGGMGSRNQHSQLEKNCKVH